MNCVKCCEALEYDDTVWADPNGQIVRNGNDTIWCVPCLPAENNYKESQ